MVESSHAEMERFHYRAIRESAEYREECRQSLIADTIAGYASYRYPAEEPSRQVIEHIHRHSRMGEQEFKLLRELQGQVRYLLNKDKERQPQKSRYRRYER